MAGGGYWAVHVRRAGRAYDELPGNLYILGPVARRAEAVQLACDRFQLDTDLSPSVAVFPQVIVADESRAFVERFMAAAATEGFVAGVQRS